MIKEIKYIGFFDIPSMNTNRVSSPAAVNKMNYICDAINNAGFNVLVISPSWRDDTKVGEAIFSKNEISVHKAKKVIFCPTFGTMNKLMLKLKVVYSLLWLFFFMLLKIKKNEKVLVYHSPWLALPVLLAKKLKKFQLILEVEEIYGDVSSLHSYFDKLEDKIIRCADGYLLATDLLVNRVDHDKPNVIIYGTYERIEKKSSPPDDGKIHLVYAGIIDSEKAGAFNAIESARYLSDLYRMHIIGFGEVEKLLKRIEEINNDLGAGCKIVFDGSKSGDEFIEYCQSCHIGLSTQKMSGKYLDTSFPSKVLSYLAMGLCVVSGKINCVEKSKIGHLLNYYTEDNPEQIATAIKETNLNLSDSGFQVISDLNDNFINEIILIFNDDQLLGNPR